MNAEYTLSPDLVFCEVDGGAIFLNLKTERYLGMSRAQFELLRKRFDFGRHAADSMLEPRCPTDERDQSMLEGLVAGGVLARGAGERLGCGIALKIRQRTVEKPLDSVLNHGASVLGNRIRPIEVAAFAWAVLSARAKLSLLKLKGTVCSIERNAVSIDREDSDRTATRDLVGIFLQLRPWFYTARDQCLFDSLVLVEFLRQYHVPATYVIGVTAKPFSAHCWVQLGALVLNDDVERVAQFTPILSV